jgi:hypothetical protein
MIAALAAMHAAVAALAASSTAKASRASFAFAVTTASVGFSIGVMGRGSEERVFFLVCGEREKGVREMDNLMRPKALGVSKSHRLTHNPKGDRRGS